MDEFVIETMDPNARLIFSNRQIDSDMGFVWGFDCELILPGLSPVKTSAVRSDEQYTVNGITDHFHQMSVEWMGWQTPKRWRDHWSNLAIECRNSRQPCVKMDVELRPNYEFEPLTPWKICASLQIEIRQLERIARHAAAFFGTHPN